jgi:hypothetical protein
MSRDWRSVLFNHTADRETFGREGGTVGRPCHNGDSHWVKRAMWLFVGLGLFLRTFRFLLRFPLWGDEAALAANFIDRGYLDLLHPLHFQQVAPPLFLWIELFFVRCLGFHEWSLRAFPFLCSLATVLLFRHVAVRFLNGAGRGNRLAALVAVAVFSVSYYPLRHGVEAKQYASDLLISLCLISLALEWLRDPRRVACLWWLVALCPLAVSLSHPAVFVAGGIGVALAASVWREGKARVWMPFLSYGAALAVAFAVTYAISTGQQIAAAADEGIMSSYWARSFPPLARPLHLLKWCIAVHCGQMFSYPIGGTGAGLGAVTLVCFATGAIWSWRSGRGAHTGVLLAPFALTFVAAAMGRYPYGGYARVSQHLAPMICLLAGGGAALLMEWVRRDRARRRVQVAALSLLGLFGGALALDDVTSPYRTEHDRRVREFARWFWQDKAIDAELVCACSDLRQSFFRRTYLWRGIAQYLCNQRIYSARARAGGSPPNDEAITSEHPLRCVVFSRPGLSRDEASFEAWLGDLERRFEWVGYERHDFHKPHDHGPDIERIEVFEFAPREALTEDTTQLSPNPKRRAFGQRAN